jgi:hypothetical protein
MMLDLPSTTEVDRRLPKEAFYGNLKLNRKTKGRFVSQVERIVIANSIKATTANVLDGENVHEILVMEIVSKGEPVSDAVLLAIEQANRHSMVFACKEGEAQRLIVHRRGTHSAPDLEKLVMRGSTLDDVWDSFCAQIVFGTVDGLEIDTRIERHERQGALESEIAVLEQRCMKEKQINKRNALFAQMQDKKRQLAQFEER